jgi:hypothetical protein
MQPQCHIGEAQEVQGGYTLNSRSSEWRHKSALSIATGGIRDVAEVTQSDLKVPDVSRLQRSMVRLTLFLFLFFLRLAFLFSTYILPT